MYMLAQCPPFCLVDDYICVHYVRFRFQDCPVPVQEAQATIAEHFPGVKLCAEYAFYKYGHLERRIFVKYQPQDDVLQYQMNAMTAASQLSAYSEAMRTLGPDLEECDRRIIFLSKLAGKQSIYVSINMCS